MAEIVMPRLSDTMEEGTILRWLVASGERVKRGQELVEIETDKANMTYESDQEGVLERIADEGDTLAVGVTIARVGGGEDRGAETTSEAKNDKDKDEPAWRPAGVRAVGGATERGDSYEAASSQAVPAVGQQRDERVRVRASPLARRIAEEKDVDLHTVRGSGPGGRIVKADVEGAGDTEPPAAAGPVGVATAKGETTEVELTRTQQTIARRMAESKATIPHFALTAEVDMEACVALRAELKKLAPQQHAPAGAAPAAGAPGEASDEAAPTYNDMVVKASALALREEPRANSSYRDGKLQLHARVNVGVAVAVDADGQAGSALVVPTVFDADKKSLGEIARETRMLAAKVRNGTITPPELGGGTFTVSNLGMFGVTSFTAIVNPPQAAILSVGALEPRAVVRDGELTARNTMTITIACDHRILYGADAARFLKRIRELLEAPAALTL